MRKQVRIGLLAAAMLLTAPIAAQSEDATVVRIETGALHGEAQGGVLSWKGIPFAAPPTGVLRWRAPQPAAHWQGVREAKAYGHDCMQVPFPSDAAPLGTPPAEDCLYANVWRPANAAGKLPVIVWIYGGGFVNGGASPPTYSGAELAKQGVLFMSFNYRVGRFGTFAHPALTKANEDGGLLGNYGYMDQLAALKWVQRNIAAFGGDPDNVTIVGESAGGMSVHTLVTSPLAKDLFDKAVAMSGGDGGGIVPGGLASVEQIGVEFARSKGIEPDAPDALAKLRALSAETVTDGLNMMKLFVPDGPRTFASPFPDGKLAVPAAEAYRSGRFSRVPMMIGATSADIGGKTGSMVKGARDIETIVAGQGVPVYAYRFSYVAENGPSDAPPGADAGAGHATDIPFFFDTQAVKYGDATTPRDNAMGKTISAYLVNFARSGDPNGQGLPALRSGAGCHHGLRRRRQGRSGQGSLGRRTRRRRQVIDAQSCGSPACGSPACGPPACGPPASAPADRAVQGHEPPDPVARGTRATARRRPVAFERIAFASGGGQAPPEAGIGQGEKNGTCTGDFVERRFQPDRGGRRAR